MMIKYNHGGFYCDKNHNQCCQTDRIEKASSVEASMVIFNNHKPF